jgi:general secretion pathway protein I
MRRGFTLIEVVVALAILGLALMAIFDLNSGAVASHAYAKRLSVVTMLARSKMTDIEQELYDKGFDVDDREISGDFRAEGWEAFTWKAQILAPRTTDVSPDKLIDSLFNLPPGKDGISGLAALLGSGRDGGIGGAAGSLSSLSSQLTNMVPQGGASALPPGATQASGLAALGPMAGLAQTQMTQLLQTIQKGVREVHLTISWKEGKRTGVPGAQGVPGAPLGPGQNPFNVPPGVNTGGQTIFGGPPRGNIPQGTPLDPSGRPIR